MTPLNTPEQELDKLLVQMVYTIMRYDPAEDIMEEDREAVNEAKAQLLAWNEREKLEAQLEVITAAWENSCTISHADQISRSLASKRRYLEADLAAQKPQD